MQQFGRLSPVSILANFRKGRGLTLDQVAVVVGTDPTNLSRVEKGEQVPKRELARKLFDFYEGEVDLGAIYDWQFHAERVAPVREEPKRRRKSRSRSR